VAANALDRRRADRVAVHIDRLLLAGRERRPEALRQRQRIAGRQDRKNEIGTGDFVIARGRSARGGGARDGFAALRS